MELTLLDKITFQLKTHFPSKQSFDIADFLIDKKTWTIRYIVLDVESSESIEKKILPTALLNISTDWEKKTFFSSVSNYFFEKTDDLPYNSYVSRKKEKQIHKEFNLKPYWKNTYPNPAKDKSLFAPEEVFRIDTESKKRTPKTTVSKKDTNVFSLKNLLCCVSIKESEIGYLQDLIFDTDSWKITKVVVSVSAHNQYETYKIPLSQIKQVDLRKNRFKLIEDIVLENRKTFNPIRLVHHNNVPIEQPKNQIRI